ncbi:hypothetical protein N7452_003010 [Penicillium brevicompactum]|uniref:Uncharacterized protein n=1 Tax=Penicillium brevicompactum TaxID=5074 RepID=A0A9W9QSQ9_PENBR|nr:hypothetical protein N7452_003010 [Penicillium brevicompactum]
MAEDASIIDTNPAPMNPANKEDKAYPKYKVHAPVGHVSGTSKKVVSSIDTVLLSESSMSEGDKPHSKSEIQAPVGSAKRSVRFDESTFVHPSRPPNKRKVTEIIICLVKHRLMAVPIYPRRKRWRKRQRMELSEIRNFPNVDTFVFENTDAFSKLFSFSEYTSLTDRLPELFTKNGVTKVRFVLLKHIEEEQYYLTPLLDEDKAERIDKVINALYLGWRQACRALPKGHGIREVIFDVHKSGHRNEYYVSPLLEHPIIQHISTMMAVKAGGPFCSRLVGLEKDDNRRVYVERSLVNTKASESGELAMETRECEPEPLNEFKHLLL